jgi:hypothetical protein
MRIGRARLAASASLTTVLTCAALNQDRRCGNDGQPKWQLRRHRGRKRQRDAKYGPPSQLLLPPCEEARRPPKGSRNRLLIDVFFLRVVDSHEGLDGSDYPLGIADEVFVGVLRPQAMGEPR